MARAANATIIVSQISTNQLQQQVSALRFAIYETLYIGRWTGIVDCIVTKKVRKVQRTSFRFFVFSHTREYPQGILRKNRSASVACEF